MTLADQLEGRFRGDVRFRGEAYLKSERVAITRITPDRIYGAIRDGVEYETQLSREDGQLKMFCNCPLGAGPEPACKHLWATILAVDAGGLLTASPKAGFVPAFSAETAVRVFDDDEDEDLFGGDFSESTNSRQRRVTPAPVQQRLRPWEAALEELRPGLQGRDPAAPAVRSEREVFYEIDIEESKVASRLVIQISQRQRRANGQWGKLKPLKLRAGTLDEIERDDDCRILAFLAGATPERSNWYAQQAELQSLVYRYSVPYELSELILPLMCATGRVRLLEESTRAEAGSVAEAQPRRAATPEPRERSKPLEWDDGPAWDLSLRVEQTESQGEWQIIGELVRDDRVLPLSKVELLVPGGLVITRAHMARLNDFDAFEWVKLLSRPESVAVPAGDEHELVERLLDMPALPRLELPEALQLEEIDVEPQFLLRVRTPRGGRWQPERLLADVAFDYAGTVIPASSPKWAIIQREQRRCIRRQRSREDAAWSHLQQAGFRRLLDQRRGSHDVEVPARELGPAVRALIAQGWQISADGQQVHQPAAMQFQIRTGIDWFELHAKVDFEGRSVPFPELLAALARGDSTVRLSDGSLGILPEEWIKKYGLLAGLGVAKDDHVRFQQNQLMLLDALLATREQIDYDAKFTELRDRLETYGGIESTIEPVGFHGSLRGYQRDGLGWLKFLQSFGFGGCLADDMGLGKTVQMLAVLRERRDARSEHLPSLVVVPKSLMFNWHQESERFTPELKVLEYAGLEREALRKKFSKTDIILTTYGTLRRDALVLKDVAFDYVVLDEAQTIKNAGSQVAKAARLLRANHRIALSGTPIENHMGDLWSIFEFLNPGMLGRSSVMKLCAADAEDENARRMLSHALRPFILRRTKKQVANELPEKVEQTIYCRMTAEQRHLYDELREHYRNSLLGIVADQGLARSKMHVLEALLRLRQAACHPALLDKSSDDKPCGKLDVLCPHLEELLEEGHKALVFSQFTSMLAIVRKHLDQRNITYEYLDGQTRDRKKRVERFQSDEKCGVFLISLKAGGLGLNLTAADYVFLLDPWWNPAVETQAIDRAHRVGQNRQVFAYRLISRNTVEEKIAELQGRKRKLADAILQADSNLMQDLSMEDLEMLLS